MAKTKETSTISFEEMLAKKLGKSVVIDIKNVPPIEKFSSGSLTLDKELKGGVPKGYMLELFADPQCGKTTTAIEMATSFQKKYPTESILWVDLEKVFDDVYNKAIGLDTSTGKFILTRPTTGEDAWDIIIEFAKNFKGGLVVLDSVSLLLPITEDTGDMGKSQMGSAARLNSQGMRKLWPHMSSNGTTFIAINQMRADIGATYGDGLVTTGGKGWAFYARTRLRLRKSQSDIKEERDQLQIVKFNLVKATYGNENTVAVSRIVYGKGIDTSYELITMGVEDGLIDKSGSWYSYKGQKLGQGLSSVLQFFDDNIEFRDELVAKINNNDFN